MKKLLILLMLMMSVNSANAASLTDTVKAVVRPVHNLLVDAVNVTATTVGKVVTGTVRAVSELTNAGSDAVKDVAGFVVDKVKAVDDKVVEMLK